MVLLGFANAQPNLRLRLFIHDLLNQGLVQAFEAQPSLEMPPVGALTAVTVSTQVRVVDIATDHGNRGHQRHQKLPLRFAKGPAAFSRPARIVLRLSIGVPCFTYTRTL